MGGATRGSKVRQPLRRIMGGDGNEDSCHDEADDGFHELQRTSAFRRKNSRGSDRSPSEPRSPVLSSPGVSEPGSVDSQVNIRVSLRGSIKHGIFNRGTRAQSI